MPENLHAPPPGATKKKLAKFYTDREVFRYTVHKVLTNGAIQVRCPQCSGRVRTNAKTYNLRKRPNKTAPYIHIEDEYCCQGTVTIPPEDLDTYQEVPFGTLAWIIRYYNRLQIENVNGMLKSRRGLKDGWCRAFGLAAHTLGVLALAVAHNIREIRRYNHRKQQNANILNQPSGSDTPPPSAPTNNAPTSRGPP